MSRCVVFICILVLFLCSLFSSGSFAEDDGGSIIRVPQDFQSIQEAVDAAGSEDVILVAPGLYSENVVVNKSVTIIGEDRNNTIIDCGCDRFGDFNKFAFHVFAKDVIIKNLTITHASRAVWVENACNVLVQSNRIMSNIEGITLVNTSQCLVKNNIVLDNWGGGPDLTYGGGIILISNNSIVTDNFLSGNMEAITVGHAHNNTIVNNTAVGTSAIFTISSSNQNTILNNTVNSGYFYITHSYYNIFENNSVLDGGGIGTGLGAGNMFYKNLISHCDVGFTMERAQDVFVGNLIINNTKGINIHFSNGSTFYHNILINNTVQVPKDVYTNINNWDNGFEGNYWSNYTGVDSDYDAIGDTPQVLDELNMDRYPLTAPINIFDAGVWNNTERQIHIISNSTITNFQLNTTQAIIRFNITGKDSTNGFCRITIPNIIIQDMWQGNYTILIDNTEPSFQKNWTDSTNTYIYFTYQHTQHIITIMPEYPQTMLLPLLMLATILSIIFFKKKQKH
jgi:nitrous oxidase accessory protein